MINEVIHGDCLEVMKDIPDKSVDMILCDLPYGTTACKWDTIIPFNPLWEQYERVIKDKGAIVLTSKEPFTCRLRASNIGIFKQSLVWDKKNADNPMQAKRRHLNTTEDISIFYKTQCTFNPQGLKVINKTKGGKSGQMVDNSGKTKNDYIQTYTNYPKNILTFNIERGYVHPTQKPVLLFEYLIRTFSNEGETILDNASGSSTTAVACIKTGRNYICIEKEKQYVDISNKRISDLLYANS